MIIVLIRLALSVIFGIAGVTKLLDQKGTREAVENFGAPKSLAPAIALVLPFVELAIAAGVLFSTSAWWSAFAALLVLGLFIVAISINLARGQTHECHCFGQLYSRPLGWPTLVRNIVFALGAAFLLWPGSESAGEIISTLVDALAGFSAAQLVLLAAALVGVVSITIYIQRRSANKTQPAVDKGLPIDSIAPHFELEAYAGGKQSLADLLAYGKPLLLIFTNPHCGPCIVLFQEIKEWQQLHDDKLTIALITRGTIKDNFVNIARNSLGHVLLEGEQQVATQYHARATPTAVAINPNGKIASPIAGGAGDIRKLLETFVGNSHDSAPNTSANLAVEGDVRYAPPG
ncbi:MAG: thioredoxin fold domain-containing protein [Acidobacteriota bacterium]|nr:thioredoxin fold domain-containing protein [Acidobacteriota bacterium]